MSKLMSKLKSNKIDCAEAERLMELFFDKNIQKEELKTLEMHCKKCVTCRVKFYDFKSTTLPDDQKTVDRVLAINRELDEVAHKRKKVFVVISIVLVICILFGWFSVVTANGQNTFMARYHYGVSKSYDTRTAEHPSFDDVKTAMDLCKSVYPKIGKGTILLSMTYNDKLSFKKKYGSENAIIVNFSYIRVFPNEKSKTFLSRNREYAFVVMYNEDLGNWKVVKNIKLAEEYTK